MPPNIKNLPRKGTPRAGGGSGWSSQRRTVIRPMPTARAMAEIVCPAARRARISSQHATRRARAVVRRCSARLGGGGGAAGVGPGSAPMRPACTAARRSRLRSTSPSASAALLTRWKRSATCRAPGAPWAAASAYSPARSRDTISVPGWARSQATSGAASRPRRTSTGRRVSRSTNRVAYRLPRRSAKSSTPSTRGAAVSGGTARRSRRSSVSGLTGKPIAVAVRAPASAPTARATTSSSASAPLVRPARVGSRASMSSAKVRRGQAGFAQTNRRTVRTKRTRRPRHGRSRGRRR
jgi:hypothetical protein